MATADHFGGQIKIRICGNVHRHVLPDFDAQIGARDNVIYSGPYDYPTGLAEVYGACDVVWAQDLWQRGDNSDWLLPNRIYEASWFGCPSIAVVDTETGRKVATDKLGFTVDEPSAEALVALLKSLDHDAIADASQALLDTQNIDFVLRPQDVQDALDPVLCGAAKVRP
jgi:succinoglycan biosynthesis protein ExoL